MAKQVRDGLHRHVAADYLGRKGGSEQVGAGPRDDDAGATQRPCGDGRDARPGDLLIRGSAGEEYNGKSPRARTPNPQTAGELPEVKTIGCSGNYCIYSIYMWFPTAQSKVLADLPVRLSSAIETHVDIKESSTVSILRVSYSPD